jgi:solute carrier family 8 (sodium/calcium exchanger)
VSIYLTIVHLCFLQLGTLLGCVVGLEASVAGITIIAIGTSLPDTFASRTAALHDQGADAAIGNVTGKKCFLR